MTDLGALHPGLAIVGVAAAGLALAVDRWSPIGAADLAVAVVGIALAVDGQIPPVAAGAIVLLAVAGTFPHVACWVAVGLGGVALLFARADLPMGARGVLAAGLLAALVPPQPQEPVRAGWVRALLLPAALVATVLGAPDTEAPVAWTAAAAVALVGMVLLPNAAPPSLATWGAVAWVAVDGYRGRPAGVAAAVVVVGGLVALRLVQHKADPRKAMSRNSLRTPVPLPLVCGAAIVAMWGAARTFGLRAEVTTREAAAAGLVAAAVATLGFLSETPLPARTRRG